MLQGTSTLLSLYPFVAYLMSLLFANYKKHFLKNVTVLCQTLFLLIVKVYHFCSGTKEQKILKRNYVMIDNYTNTNSTDQCQTRF